MEFLIEGLRLLLNPISSFEVSPNLLELDAWLCLYVNLSNLWEGNLHPSLDS